MKIIKPSVEFFGTVPTDYEGAIRFIEMAGRTCYKSEDKITDTSAEKFVKGLIDRGHLAMVEHSNFVIRMKRPEPILIGLTGIIDSITGKYLNVVQNSDYIYVGGSLTAWYQRGNIIGWDDVIFQLFAKAYGCLFNMALLIPETYQWQVCTHDEIPKELHRYSAKFICDRGVSHELVRHRPCSFAQESTRYVNYSGKDMEFVEPAWVHQREHGLTYAQLVFDRNCNDCEHDYKKMIKLGCTPQQARAVLPNSLKTEIVVTADAAEWRHIRKLRTHPTAHPDMRRVMEIMPWDKFLEEE